MITSYYIDMYNISLLDLRFARFLWICVCPTIFCPSIIHHNVFLRIDLLVFKIIFDEVEGP